MNADLLKKIQKPMTKIPYKAYDALPAKNREMRIMFELNDEKQSIHSIARAFIHDIHAAHRRFISFVVGEVVVFLQVSAPPPSAEHGDLFYKLYKDCHDGEIYALRAYNPKIHQQPPPDQVVIDLLTVIEQADSADFAADLLKMQKP